MDILLRKVNEGVGPTKEELYDLYWVKGLFYHQISKQFGVTERTIQKWMKKFGVPGRGQEWNKGLTLEEIFSVDRAREISEKISKGQEGRVPWNKGKHTGQVPWNKGLTKETDPRVKEISEAKKNQVPWNKGRKPTKDELKHLKEICFKKGHISWTKGKHHSEAIRQKISEALTGHIFSEEHKKKLSEALLGENHPMYGKHHSAETKKKMSLAQLGENNSMWFGGVSFEPYGPEFNDELKEQIRERDNHQCQICGLYQEELTKALDVHHIDYNKENNDPQNLVSLHGSCHAKTSVNRDEWEAYFNEIGVLIPAIT